MIPGLWGYDLSSLVLALLIEIIRVSTVLFVKGYGFDAPAGSMLLGLFCLGGINIIKTFIYIVLVSTLIQAVLSWINPHSPVAPILYAMTRPFLGMFRRRIPPIGGVDLSPLFVLVVCQLLLMWPVLSLYSLFQRML